MSNRSGTPLLYTRWRAHVLSFCALAGVAFSASCASGPSESVLSKNESVLSTTAVTQGADEMRTSWYDNQPQLAPATVSGFKQVFNTTLIASQLQSASDKVLAQPLVVGNNVLVVTEANNVYLVDGTSGAVVANRALGAGFDASAAFGCGDISPTVGITGTPVVDKATNTAYFYSKNAAGDYSIHAIDTGNLAERAGFPVTVTGTAQNDATAVFTSRLQLQRPALLLLNGVVYAAFGAHCDAGAYRGWVIGVSTAGVVKARFTTVVGTVSAGNGNGIWMSGGGLASDGPNRIFFVTGNGVGTEPGPTASTAPSGNLVESVVRTDVQADGSLKAMDFFAPFNAYHMADADLSGGAAVLLPSQFGTASVPNTALVVGKEGTLYLMDRTKLGGFKMGANNTDAVLSEIPVNGTLRGHSAIWPGDGGYVYVNVTGGDVNNVGYRMRVFKYAPNAQGVPSLSLVGVAGVGTTGNGDDFGQYSGSPIVTSDGLTSGSAVVWVTSNTGALRAYSAVPVNGVMNRLIEIGFNDQAKFTKPGVGNGRIYVGTDNGRLVGFGATASPIVASPVQFGTVTVGQ